MLGQGVLVTTRVVWDKKTPNAQFRNTFQLQGLWGIKIETMVSFSLQTKTFSSASNNRILMIFETLLRFSVKTNKTNRLKETFTLTLRKINRTNIKIYYK